MDTSPQIPKIHPTAVVDVGATLARDVEIGPFCVIGAHVTLDEGVRVLSHAVIDGHTTVGAHTIIHPFASLGQTPVIGEYLTGCRPWTRKIA